MKQVAACYRASHSTLHILPALLHQGTWLQLQCKRNKNIYPINFSVAEISAGFFLFFYLLNLDGCWAACDRLSRSAAAALLQPINSHVGLLVHPLGLCRRADVVGAAIQDFFIYLFFNKLRLKWKKGPRQADVYRKARLAGRSCGGFQLFQLVVRQSDAAGDGQQLARDWLVDVVGHRDEFCVLQFLLKSVNKNAILL